MITKGLEANVGYDVSDCAFRGGLIGITVGLVSLGIYLKTGNDFAVDCVGGFGEILQSSFLPVSYVGKALSGYETLTIKSSEAPYRALLSVVPSLVLGVSLGTGGRLVKDLYTKVRDFSQEE